MRGEEEAVICASPTDQVDLTAFLARSRSRTISSASSMISDLSELSEEDLLSQSLPEDLFFARQHSTDEPMTPETPDRIAPTDMLTRNRRVRFVSESDDSCNSTLTEVGVGCSAVVCFNFWLDVACRESSYVV